MYFCGWLCSWVCEDCAYADYYWRLRAFWAGVKRKLGVPKRCPDPQLWHDMWSFGAESSEEGLEF